MALVRPVHKLLFITHKNVHLWGLGLWNIIWYLKHKRFLFLGFYQHLKNININIILGTWQIDWNKVRKRRDNSN